MYIIHLIEYNALNTLHRKQYIEYNEDNKMHWMQCIECNRDIFCIHIAITARRNLAIFVSINPLYRAVN